MSTTTLLELRTVYSAFQLRQRVLAGLGAKNLPVGDWAPTNVGGLENASIDMAVGALVALGAVPLSKAIGMGFLDFAETTFLDFLAKRFYLLDRVPATKTIQAITISCAREAGPYPLQNGDLIVSSDASGNRYRSIEEGVITPGMGQPAIHIDGVPPVTIPGTPAMVLPIPLEIGTIEVEVPAKPGVEIPGTPDTDIPAGPAPLILLCEAEADGAAYNDPADTVTTLVSSLPGVTVNNAPVVRPVPAALMTGGASRGTILAFHAPAGTASDRYRIRIVTSGQAFPATAQFVYSTDDGQTWSTPAACLGAVALPGLIVFFQNAPSATPSFIAGDVFFFANVPIVRQGSDAESDDRLRRRCRLRWTTLSDVPRVGTFELWAKTASPEVQRVRTVSDPNAANRALVYIGSSLGRCGPDTLIAVQSYINARLDIGETVSVLSVDTLGIVPSGTVFVDRTRLAEIQIAANNNWNAYLGSVDIAGTVRLAELEQAIMDAGAIDVSSLALVGGAPNMIMGPSTVPVPLQGVPLSLVLSWEPV